MIGALMLYGTAIAALLGGAALAMERVLRLYGGSGRLVWLGAIAASALLPIIARSVAHPEPVVAGSALADLGIADSGSVIGIGPVTVPFTVPSIGMTARIPNAVRISLEAADPLLLILWAGMSGCLLLYLLLSTLALTLRSRQWAREVLEGEQVLVSTDVGPCVFGLFRPRIVLPRWVTEISDHDRQLTLIHEREHIQARDPQILLFAGTVLLAMPWNVALWWQLRRLRLAIEMDCDRRVLRRVPAVRAYAALLLEVGSRGSLPGRFAWAAFAEPKSFLETRIEAMTTRLGGNRAIRTFVLVGVAVVCLAVSCAAPSPVARIEQPSPEPGGFALSQVTREVGSSLLPPVSPSPAEVTSSPQTAGSLSSPTMNVASSSQLPQNPLCQYAADSASTVAAGMHPPDCVLYPRGGEVMQPISRPKVAYTVPPWQSPGGGEALGSAIDTWYPPQLRDAGIGGVTNVAVFLDEQGRIESVELLRSSGHPELDEAAVRIAEGLPPFTPARNGDTPVAIGVVIPIRFVPRNMCEGRVCSEAEASRALFEREQWIRGRSR